MQIKKFEAPTLQEALDNVKRELGPEAIILQTKKNKKGFGLMSKASVEITAAVSERSMHRKDFTEKRMPEKTRKEIESMAADRQADLYQSYLDKHLEKAMSGTQDRVELKSASNSASTTKMMNRRYVDIEDDDTTAVAPKARTKSRSTATPPPAPIVTKSDTEFDGGTPVEAEMRELRKIIAQIQARQEGDASRGGHASASPSLTTAELHDVFEQLLLHGIERRYALPLIRQASFDLGPEGAKDTDRILDSVAGSILEGVAVIPGVSEMKKTGETGPITVALVGPTGVGKTTTLAKIASVATAKAGMRVGLINLDNYKVAAFEQLATYAKILNTPFRSARTSDEFQAALRDFRDLDLVIIDTAGRSQKDTEALAELEKILSQVDSLVTYLVVSASTRDFELVETASRFSVFHPQAIVVSKLDEATAFGALFNLAQKTKLPYVYFTTGQRVPEDIEPASRERVAALVLDI